jgi:hypothetical protein
VGAKTDKTKTSKQTDRLQNAFKSVFKDQSIFGGLTVKNGFLSVIEFIPKAFRVDPQPFVSVRGR